MAEIRGSRLHRLVEEAHAVDLANADPSRRVISRAAIRRAVAVVRRFNQEVRELECGAGVVVCTAAVRHANNRSAVLRALRKPSACRVRVLSARQEGLLTAAGVMTGLPASRRQRLVVDLGGGSTELIDPRTDRVVSIPCGAALATSRWLKGRPRLRDHRTDYYRQRASISMDSVGVRSRTGPGVIGVGGTITTLAAIHAGLREFDSERIDGRTLDADWIGKTADRFARMDRGLLEKLIPYDPRRARVLTAGTFLWEAVLKRLGVTRVRVSVRGLRWGAAQELALRAGTRLDSSRRIESP
ncbi:MAG: hypothetical protein HY304_03745 [candidate division Zixibacteria bacterium]|nr:hypothetical protein [candidate division Zixibacteria bacterium]